MDNNIRDNLIQVLNEWGTKNTDSVPAESIADYLLTKNILILPYKIGEEKYVFSNNRNEIIKGRVHAIYIDNNILIDFAYEYSGVDYICYEQFLPNELFDTEEDVKKAILEGRIGKDE